MATKWRIVIGTLCVLCIAMSCAVVSAFSSVGNTESPLIIDIRPETTTDDIREATGGGITFRALCRMMRYDTPVTGHYVIQPGTSWLHLVRMLKSHSQSPVRITIPSVRTMDRLASFLSERLMADSADFAAVFCDSTLLAQMGYNKYTLPALFVPNTYELWWDTSVTDFMHRMQHEHDAFWSDTRLAACQRLHMTPNEVTTLASIIDEETAANAEKPMVAGMYLNRLRQGMPLQADPTVKYAVGDFSLRRILHGHLAVESPYNTYIHEGLPPGPIRIATVASIDAVLHAATHPYLYMCANADFSGTHVFAATYSEHLRNARLYQRALNTRGIH